MRFALRKREAADDLHGLLYELALKTSAASDVQFNSHLIHKILKDKCVLMSEYDVNYNALALYNKIKSWWS